MIKIASVNIFTRIKRRLIDNWIDETSNTLYDFSPWRNKSFWGNINNTLETNETIFSAVTRLANSLSSMPIKLYEDYKVINTNVSELLTISPNNSVSSYDFINQIETVRNEKGNAYVLIERDTFSQPSKLYLLNSDIVNIAIENNSREVYYIIHAASGNKLIIHNMDMLHFKHIVGSNMLKGISPIDVLKNTTDFDAAIRKFNLSEMQKPDSFVLKYGSNIDVKKRKSVIENFKQFYEENGGILFQEPGVEIDPITKKYVSEDIVASENLTRERVANVFQLPAVFLNANESSNFTKNEELNRFFLQHTLISIIKQYESEFNRKLLTPLDRKKNRYFKFNVKAYLRADSATQAEVYFKAVRSGYYTINEIRELEDLPPVENGDKPFISGDLYPIDTPLELRKSLKGGDKDDNEKVFSNQKENG
ncbi:phage portal protein [Staphylococcus haemolyticus]|uniref:Phage portal protein n=1 Tax=Staphylococcus haemolyticus TaxID=1283 RepID=A0ABU3IEH8_STAHA|nr:phage portal protein [Staphylococcus haemolyticus]AKC76360.1 phage portal protein [Staphylococcus haemolyticus]AUV67628.1 phage portal protein [Staphylococcus haemolyticus]AUV70006.1 phage portal protein [Staphylococcus haemolyticus]MBE7377454.1 phage portal protein [Staphylococcus haemolyticus]MBF2285952.1 phage portal protein [Staphylococcus haemolyticus]